MAILRSRPWVILVTVVLALAAGGAYVALAPRQYQAEADILVTPVARDATTLIGLGLIPESVDPTRDVETVSRLVTTSAVAALVQARLRLTPAQRALVAEVVALPVAQSSIVAVTVTAKRSPALAARVANAYAAAFIAYRSRQLRARIDQVTPVLRARIARLSPVQRAAFNSPSQQLDQLVTLRSQGDPTLTLETPAALPSSPVSPRPVLTLVAAGIGGLVLGLGGVLVVELLDPRLRRESQLRRRYQVPVLARIPRERRRIRRRPLAPDELSPLALDSYRGLRASLIASMNGSTGARTLLVTGPTPSDGKTTTAVNLAFSLATAGKRVILMEMDARRPALGRALGIKQGHGFSDVIAGVAPLEQALVTVGHPKLRVLLAGPPTAATPDAVARGQVAEVLREAERLGDWVILDAPPLNYVPDSFGLAGIVDDVLLVVRIGRSDLRDLGELADQFAQRDVAPTGFVIVGADTRAGYGKYY